MFDAQEPLHCSAALYFLDGQYLFRYKHRKDQLISKFITSNDVKAAFSGSDEDSGWLSPGVMRCGTCEAGNWFVYYHSKAMMKLQFKASGPIREYEFIIPATVLYQCGDSTYLWAIKGKFEPSAPLYHAPFPNVYGDGRVCWGKNIIANTAAENAEKIWGLFFDSIFNNDLSNGKSLTYPHSVVKMYEDLKDANRKRYPTNDLMQTHMSVADIPRRGRQL